MVRPKKRKLDQRTPERNEATQDSSGNGELAPPDTGAWRADPTPQPAGDKSDPESGFAVVGIGASAGGVEAISALLHGLPNDTGMAFVIVMHLDPKHESQLAEIMSRATPMPVRTAEHDMPVRPNSVYVIPPGKDLVFHKCVLQLSPRTEFRGQHHPIDRLLRSLAEQNGHHSIGVILSGSATDGTLGLEEIKGAGGLTFAQDDTAEYTSMPRSAITAGCVDFVLSPAEIAREIARISRHPYLLPFPEPEPADKNREPALRQILEIVRRSNGVDFTHYKRNTIYRRIARRMVLHKVQTFEEYLRILQSVPSEAEELHRDILINVTSFFRNPETYEALKTHVFPVLTADRSRNDPVRVWVLGCSSGEEAYSIAIAFTEYAEESGLRIPLQVFASDINGVGIEKARAGIYSKNLVADVSPERLRRFFTEVDGSYRISKLIRDACIFARQDVLSDPPFSRMDLIACRNVLIYLEPVLQKRLLPIIHYALKPTGYLWLGSSETIGSHRDLFEAFDPKHKIYSRKPGHPILAFPFTVRLPNSPRVPVYERPSDALQALLEPQKEADRLLIARYAPPAVVTNSQFDVLHFRGDTGPYLAPAHGRATLNLLKMLREGLLVGVRGALLRAKREAVPVRDEGLRVRSDGGYRGVNVDVVPFKSAPVDELCFLVTFEEPNESISARLRQTEVEMRQTARDAPAGSAEAQREIARLKQELVSTREYLQSVIEGQEAANEELQSTNEEVLSGNEELQSINEELETSKEEIQSSNEELATVNEELSNRNAELFRSNSDILNLLGTINMALVMLGSDLRIRSFTPAAEKLLNLIASDAGRPISDIQLNLGLTELDALISNVIATATPYEQEVEDKHGRWYLLRLRPYKTLENKIDGAVLVLVDIDQLKRGGEILRRHSDLLEQTQVPIFAWELTGGITYWNHGAEETYGFAKEEALGRTVQELLRTSMPRAKLVEALETHGEWSGELTKHHRDGTPVVVESRMTLSRDGGHGLVLETNLPITERKQKEEALRLRAEELARADRKKDEFLAILAHELRNPLASVRGAVQVLRLSQADAATREQAESTLDRQSANMIRMVDDLLDVSRITRGDVTLRRDSVDLVTLLERIVEVAQLRVPEHSRDLRIELPSEPLYVEGDPMRLEQIFGNLINNACKFGRDGGHVWVTAQREPVPPTDGRKSGNSHPTNSGSKRASGDAGEQLAVVRVRDDGIGIEPGRLDEVFDMFVQLDRSSTRPTEGLGIGLTLTRNLVRLHGGDIEVKSEGRGRGSEFVVRLPALPASFKPTAAADSAPPPLAANARRVRVIVVDDNRDAAAMMETLMRLSGYEVRSVHDGLAALEAVEKFEPDVVLLDIGLPGIDGHEVARRLRQTPAGKRAFVVALTGYAQDRDIAASRRSGFDRHLTKPVDVQVLRQLIKETVGESAKK